MCQKRFWCGMSLFSMSQQAVAGTVAVRQCTPSKTVAVPQPKCGGRVARGLRVANFIKTIKLYKPSLLRFVLFILICVIVVIFSLFCGFSFDFSVFVCSTLLFEECSVHAVTSTCHLSFHLRFWPTVCLRFFFFLFIRQLLCSVSVSVVTRLCLRCAWDSPIAFCRNSQFTRPPSPALTHRHARTHTATQHSMLETHSFCLFSSVSLQFNLSLTFVYNAFVGLLKQQRTERSQKIIQVVSKKCVINWLMSCTFASFLF